jgi:SAM-dependent methyltransferase
MIAQRPAGSAPCVQGVAEALPVAAKSFDCAMAILTLHHWADWRKGLSEIRRVARRAVILTFDPDKSLSFWLVRDYFPEFDELDRERMPRLSEVMSLLGDGSVDPVPIPHDCVDGFQCAYWRRPEKYLSTEVRKSISTFSLLTDPTEGLERLASDLKSGRWRERNADILQLDSLDLGYRLVCCDFN